MHTIKLTDEREITPYVWCILTKIDGVAVDAGQRNRPTPPLKGSETGHSVEDDPAMSDDNIKDEHALAIGKIAMAWNEYHELLGDLFASLFTKSHYSTTLAIWHCLDNDRTQRRLLRAAAETYLHFNEKGLEELLWLLNKTDTILAQQRNIGVHAPLNALFEIDGVHKLLPVPGPGNRNAKQLDGRDVLREYAHYEQLIKKMRTFAFSLRFELTLGKSTDDPWPDRPRLSSRPS